MNLLLRVGFMIKVSLFYKDSSAKGGITDLGGHKKKWGDSFTVLWPHLVAIYCQVSQTFSSPNLRRMRGSGRESSRAPTLNRLGRGQTWPARELLFLRTLCWVHGISSQIPRERAAAGSHGILKGAIFKPICKVLLLCLLSHLLEAHCLEHTGGGGRGGSVCACVCVCVLWGSSMKTLRACAELCGANWHQEGTYAKSHSTWPLNLDKLSISCTRGAFFLLALV